MRLISELFFMIVITSFTGTVALGLWTGMRKILLRYRPDLLYLILRCVCLLYLLPVGYVLIQFTVEDGYIISDSLWQMNFSATGIMTMLYLFCECIWVTLTFRGILRYVRQGILWNNFCRGSVPEEDERVRKEFREIREKMGIRRKIRLRRNPRFDSAMITGIFRCSIVLPAKEYTAEQLRVIFYHELTHYKSRDLWYKLCGVCIGALHSWNPFVKNLLMLLNEWSECDCDRKATDALRGR